MIIAVIAVIMVIFVSAVIIIDPYADAKKYSKSNLPFL
jgi:hypothetical protein